MTQFQIFHLIPTPLGELSVLFPPSPPALGEKKVNRLSNFAEEMSTKITLDKEAFFRRAKKIYEGWKVSGNWIIFWSSFWILRSTFSTICCHGRLLWPRQYSNITFPRFYKKTSSSENGAAFADVDALLVAVGNDEDIIYSKSTAMQVCSLSKGLRILV